MTHDASNRPYPEIQAKPDFPALEKEILGFWEKDQTFEASIENRPAGDNGENEYVFYDGPPFANGLPHYGHILTGFVKDMVPRYQTMRGKRVDRTLGWDCHGLPAEMASEKELGISGREQIINYGIGKFNDYCRESVLRYTEQWQDTMKRQARWLSFDNEYKTMDLDYMESVIWAFKTLFDKGLLYEDMRVLPYSWAAETTVSNFETRLDNSYRERTDPAATVAFTLTPQAGDLGAMKILAWTTTPWTLPSNLALCVSADITYGIYKAEDGSHYVMATDAEGRYKALMKQVEKVGSINGADLVGRQYEPLFPFFKGHENAFQILSDSFVSTEDGTGVVHMAPGFGEDDLNICRAADIKVVVPVDLRGCFTKEIPTYAGLNIFEANPKILADLKEQGRLIKREDYKHNYPHCWRTDEPLIYRAMPSWFLKVTAIRDRLVELNQNINWIPGHIKDGAFGKWLEGARDWTISRNRFWGAPLPVWKSDDPTYPRIDVYGSLEEIERDFGKRPTDLHRPYIDEFVRPNPDDPTGKSMMRRVDDVFDCWFESGAMPFAQVHYPFENKDWFEAHFPADFIVEYIAQTRGWFYTLVVLGGALFDKEPFRNVICHGVVLDENNQKLSKRLRNYPEPGKVFDSLGSDAMRWFLVGSPILRGANLAIEKDGKDIAKSTRDVLLPLWNAFHYFCLYANSENIQAEYNTASENVLDQYILAKTRELVEDIQRNMDAYEAGLACQCITRFMDVLNNWYIRRSRNRFWVGTGHEDAFNTLYTVLHILTRTLAPFVPLTSEYIFKALSGARSVHLEDWPNVADVPARKELITTMDRIREICSLTKGIRETHKLRNRLPLATLTVAGRDLDALRPFFDLIADEVNVKTVNIRDDLDAVADNLLYVFTPKVGKRLGKNMKAVMAASRTGDWTLTPAGTIEIAGEVLNPGEFDVRLQPKEGVAGEAVSDNTALVMLDVHVTPELEQEGLARDFVRIVQEGRKTANLNISDRIVLNATVATDGPEAAALRTHADYICEQVLGNSLNVTIGTPTDGQSLGDTSVALTITVAA